MQFGSESGRQRVLDINLVDHFVSAQHDGSMITWSHAVNSRERLKQALMSVLSPLLNICLIKLLLARAVFKNHSLIICLYSSYFFRFSNDFLDSFVAKPWIFLWIGNDIILFILCFLLFCISATSETHEGGGCKQWARRRLS